MNQSDKGALENKNRVGELMSFLAAYCTAPDAKNRDNVVQAASKLQSLFGVKSPQVEQEHHQPERLEDLLNKLKDETYVKENLKSTDEEITPEQEQYIIYLPPLFIQNKENQRIMHSFEMEQFPQYFIHYRAEEKATKEDAHKAMIKQCYRFLIRYVHGNTENQVKLREYLDDFMKDIDNNSMAVQLVADIFRDNRKFLNMSSSKIFKQIVNAAEKAEIENS
jgi:hypothetical protein